MLNQTIANILEKAKNNQSLTLSEIEYFVVDRIECIIDRPDKNYHNALYNFVEAKLDFRKNQISAEFKDHSISLLKSGRIKSLAGFYDVISIFESIASTCLDAAYHLQLTELALQFIEHDHRLHPNSESESLLSMYQERLEELKFLEEMNTPEKPNAERNPVLSESDVKEIGNGLSDMMDFYLDTHNLFKRDAEKELNKNLNLLYSNL